MGQGWEGGLYEGKGEDGCLSNSVLDLLPLHGVPGGVEAGGTEWVLNNYISTVLPFHASYRPNLLYHIFLPYI
jgi:hypothetical protein